MTNPSKTKDEKKLDFLSGYQMLGGLIGIAFIAYIFIKSDEITSLHVLILGLGILLYIFSFIAGLFLYQRNSNGLKLSLVNQILQIIGFSSWGFGFEYVSGFSFDFLLRYDDGIDITSNFGLSNWHILINYDTGIQEISFNIVAIGVAIYIISLGKKYRKESFTTELSNIGKR